MGIHGPYEIVQEVAESARPTGANYRWNTHMHACMHTHTHIHTHVREQEVTSGYEGSQVHGSLMEYKLPDL
jgi:hypothetical protein